MLLIPDMQVYAAIRGGQGHSADIICSRPTPLRLHVKGPPVRDPAALGTVLTVTNPNAFLRRCRDLPGRRGLSTGAACTAAPGTDP